MKKIYRVTYRCDSKINDFKNLFLKQVCHSTSKDTNGSEVIRAIFLVLLQNKKLRCALMKEVVRYLKENED